MDATVDLSMSTPKLKQTIHSKGYYRIIPEDMYRDELGEYHTYGIQLETTDYTGIMHDVSVCRKTVEYIVELLNRYQVSHIHMYDVITDMLP